MSQSKALLIDYEFCIGCSECELACLGHHDGREEEIGVNVLKSKPWLSKDNAWRYDFIPTFNDWCDICAEKTAKGGNPCCVDACKFNVIGYGTVQGILDSCEQKSKVFVYIP